MLRAVAVSRSFEGVIPKGEYGGGDVIVWDWGWPDDGGWTEQIIQALPENVYLMSVSEWSLPIERGGVKSSVGEYSLPSAVKAGGASTAWNPG